MTKTQALILGAAIFFAIIWGWHLATYPDALKYHDKWWWIP